MILWVNCKTFTHQRTSTIYLIQFGWGEQGKTKRQKLKYSPRNYYVPISNYKLAVLKVKFYETAPTGLRSLLGSFSINDGNGNDHAINEEFDWSSVEK